MAPHAAINTSEISEKARRDLLLLLEGVRGKKNLVLEKALAGTLNLLVAYSTLQEYGVEKAFFLENDNVDASQKNVVFLVRGEKAKTMYSVADQIKRLRRNGPIEYEFSIIWVPRRTLASDQILEESGVLGEANVTEYQLYFISLAEDLLSLELDDAFGDLYLRKDPNSIYLSARALMQLQLKHGLFPRILGKGDNARRLADLLLRMRTEAAAGEDENSNGSSFLGLTPSSHLESLIIIDREVDFPTVLLTQLTYEGLLDEVFTINANQTEVDSTIVGTPANPSASQGGASTTPLPGTKRKIKLDPKDSLYSTLTDANFTVVGPLLKKVALRLQSTYDSRPNIGTKTIAELREFVAKLPGYQSEQASLKLHTALAEEIKRYTSSDTFSRVLEVQQNIAAGADPSTQHENINELIARSLPLPTVLRLLCIYSCMAGGFRPKDYETFKLAILHGYGYQHMLTLSSLEKMCLLQPRPGTMLGGPPGGQRQNAFTSYSTVRKTLHLIVDEVNEAEPDDIAYAYSGYAPLSVRLVQCILQKSYIASFTSKQPYLSSSQSSNLAAGGWRPFEDTLKHVKGTTFDESQSGEEKAVKARQILNGSGHDKGDKTVVVFFLGGICRAEVAALRFVSTKLKEAGTPRRILICTTGIIRGDGMVGVGIEEGRFGPD